MAIAWSTTDNAPTGAWSFAAGNTQATESTASSSSLRTDAGKSLGKFYWEIKGELVDGGTTFDAFVGLTRSTEAPATIAANASAIWMRSNGSAGGTTGVAFTSGDVLRFALDLDMRAIWVAKNNGAWLGGGDPAAGTLPSGSNLAADVTWLPSVGSDNNSSSHKFTGAFGSFTYTVPTGFSALSETNTFSGVLFDSSAAPAAQVVRAYVRSTGVLAGSTVSSAVDGSWSLIVPSSAEHYLIALDADAGTENLLAFDRIVPVTST